jgi:hypothetical protein
VSDSEGYKGQEAKQKKINLVCLRLQYFTITNRFIVFSESLPRYVNAKRKGNG